MIGAVRPVDHGEAEVVRRAFLRVEHRKLEFNRLTVSGISLHSSARLSDILRCKTARRS
jgi:hypothetical protein